MLCLQGTYREFGPVADFGQSCLQCWILGGGRTNGAVVRSTVTCRTRATKVDEAPNCGVTLPENSTMLNAFHHSKCDGYIRRANPYRRLDNADLVAHCSKPQSLLQHKERNRLISATEYAFGGPIGIVPKPRGIHANGQKLLQLLPAIPADQADQYVKLTAFVPVLT